MSGDIVWIDRAVIIALHDRLLAAHGGLAGIRDEALLGSALARPRHLAAYGEPDLCGLAAAYAYGIARNHPFVDGNKRTAFLAAYVFFARNGRRLTAPEDAATWTVTALAAGELGEDALTKWMRQNTRAD
ncbi:MAG: type II toxin-antitoxin system death-on-curing family toxin [Rhodospirillales bacterium]|nr:type II toxin-antitoxin system death-on-curing family toxin [Rhodospirillales bacterium]